MKLFTTFLIAAAALSAAPITQVELVNAGNPVVTDSKVTIHGTTKYNVDIGPYTMLLNGQDVPALCIDFVDDSDLKDPWSAYVTPVGSSNLSNTYHSNFGQEYEEEAYIYSLITAPGVSGSLRTALQIAGWDITSYGITSSSYTNSIADNTYIDQALANYSNMNFSGYEIISDTQQGCEQEFIVKVAAPEPGSLLLFGSGLLLAAGFAFARRKRLVLSSAN